MSVSSRQVHHEASQQRRYSVKRVLAAYGGVFVAGSLAWGMVFDGFRPDRYDLIGAALCLIGVGVVMFSPRSGLFLGKLLNKN